MGSYTSELGVKNPTGSPSLGPGTGCTQQVARLKNPETGETIQATDGCQVRRLKRDGWVSVSTSANDGKQRGGEGGQTGGQSPQVAGLSGSGALLLLAAAGVGYGLYQHNT